MYKMISSPNPPDLFEYQTISNITMMSRLSPVGLALLYQGMLRKTLSTTFEFLCQYQSNAFPYAPNYLEKFYQTFDGFQYTCNQDELPTLYYIEALLHKANRQPSKSVACIMYAASLLTQLTSFSKHPRDQEFFDHVSDMLAILKCDGYREKLLAAINVYIVDPEDQLRADPLRFDDSAAMDTCWDCYSTDETGIRIFFFDILRTNISEAARYFNQQSLEHPLLWDLFGLLAQNRANFDLCLEFAGHLDYTTCSAEKLSSVFSSAAGSFGVEQLQRFLNVIVKNLKIALPMVPDYREEILEAIFFCTILCMSAAD